MNSEEYKKIAVDVSSKLNDYFGNFCNEFPQYSSIKNEYIKKPIHLNGMQFYAGFMSGQSKSWENYLEIPVAIEMIMLWAYKTNRILDEKQDICTDKEKIKSTVLEHDLMLSCIYTLLNVFSKKEPQNSERIRLLIEEMMSKLSYGFWIEKDRLNVNFSSLEKILSNWEQEYINRNINFNLVYDYAPLIGYALSSNDFGIIEKYINFIPLNLRFSNIGQIINDLGDFGEDIDTNVKSYQDIFSDVRNGIITFPVYKLINEKSILEALKKPKITTNKTWQKKIRELISKNNINEDIIKIASDSYERHKEFFENQITNSSTLLLKSFGMLINTKYFNQKIVFEVSPILRNRVILSDINGKEIGIYDKLLAHKEGRLHKAFSVFVFNNSGELLIQKRINDKYHSGNLWSNTCCSHLISGEDVIISAKRRLKEEMGFECDLKKKFSFVYKLDVGNGMTEHEFDIILIGKYDGDVVPNNNEVDDIKWIKIDSLLLDIKNNPDNYTSWFKVILERMGYR